MDTYYIADGEHRRTALLASASRKGQDQSCAHVDDEPCHCGDHPPANQHYRGREIRARAS